MSGAPSSDESKFYTSFYLPGFLGSLATFCFVPFGHFPDWELLLFWAISLGIANSFLFWAYQIGPTVPTSFVVGLSTVFVFIYAVVTSHKSISQLEFIGSFLIVAGAFLSIRKTDAKRTSQITRIWLSVIAVMLFAMTVRGAVLIERELTSSDVIGLAIFGYGIMFLAYATRQTVFRRRLPGLAAISLVGVVAGLMSLLGLVLFGLAADIGNGPLAAAVFAMYPAVTTFGILIARREEITPTYWTAFVFTLTGLATASLA